MEKEQIKQMNLPQQPLSELYKHIELTEEEQAEAIEKALFEARYTKAAAQNERDYLRKITEPVEFKKHTFEELFQALQNEPTFDVDDDNREVVKLLCLYFSEHEDFEKQGYSLRKGLLLFGAVGVGKTHLLHLFRNNQKDSYQVVSCQDVESIYAKNGPDINPQTGEPGLRKYFGLIPLNAGNAYGQNTLGFAFDDLGQEITNTKYFGTERNVMQEVLSQRYKNGLFTSTHITTNLNAEQIKQMYGARVADRMREMFNMISFPQGAKSRRK